MFSILKDRNYRWLWQAQVLSSVGDQVRTWAIIFWIFKMSDHSPTMQMMVLVAQYVPAIIFGPLAGVWIDRFNHKRVLYFSLIVRSLLSLAIIPFIITVNMGASLILIAISAVIAQFFQPSMSKLMVVLVPKASLLAANSLTRSTKTSLNLLGPICATALYQLFGAELSLVLDGLSFLLAAACIFIIRMDRNVDGENRRISGLFTSFWKDFFAGMQFAWGNSAVRGIFLLMCIISLGAGAVNLLNIFLVVDILELPEDHVAWGNTCQAIGMLASAILLGVISKRVKAFNWLSIGGVGIIFLGIVLLAVSPNAWIMFASRFITGIGSTVLTVSLTTLFQYEVPERVAWENWCCVRNGSTPCHVSLRWLIGVFTVFDFYQTYFYWIRCYYPSCGTYSDGAIRLLADDEKRGDTNGEYVTPFIEIRDSSIYPYSKKPPRTWSDFLVLLSI
nr:MFS transporter [Brevibacillus laterosporus]